MELSEIEPPEEEADAQGGNAAEPKYTKLRPDLQDSDLVLENSEEKCVASIGLVPSAMPDLHLPPAFQVSHPARQPDNVAPFHPHLPEVGSADRPAAGIAHCS